MERNFDSNKHVIQRLNAEKEDEVNGQRSLRERIKNLEDDLEKT
jgi:hypothetical protein